MREGEPLFRLDDTRTRSELEVIRLHLRDAALRRSQPLAELEGRLWTAPDDSQQALSEMRLFTARAEERAGRSLT